MFAWPAFGISVLSWSLVIGSVGAFAEVSVAPDDGVDELDELLDEPAVSLLLGVVPVGALVVESLGAPVPVGLFGEAGSGGVADSLVDGVTGGVAVVVVDDV